MLGSAQSVTPRPAAMPPAAPPAQPGAGSAGGPSFAHFLNDRPDPQPAHTDPVPSAPDTARESTAAANAAQARRKEGSAAPKPATPATSAQGRTPEAAAAPKPAGDAKACDDDSEPADAARDADDAQTSGLNEFTQLIGLAVPAPQPAQAAAAATALADDATEGRAVRGGRAGRAAAEATDARGDAAGGEATTRDTDSAAPNERRPTDTTARATDAPRAKGIELAADKAAAARSARSDALQAGTAPPNATSSTSAAAAPRAVAAPDALPNSFAAVLAQAQPAATAAPGATPATASARVNAALHSNAFAPELGARVSLLAVGGVQQAELQLNPADMGPVAVQIVVDGAQAQVSFHAAQAETRQALQQSLPDLAAALQSQGLTLAGGGVFQQASQHARDGDAQAQAGGAEGRDSSGTGGVRVEGSAAATQPARRAVGLLDTFA